MQRSIHHRSKFHMYSIIAFDTWQSVCIVHGKHDVEKGFEPES